MSNPRTGGTPASLGATPVSLLGTTEETARRLVEQGRFDSISEACREGLRRLDTEHRVVDRLVELGEQGMANGVAEGFEIDEFIAAMDIERHLPPGARPADVV